MAARVLIVGCGQLGSRHLQAVARVAAVREIDIVDSRPEALEIGKQRLAEVRHAGTPNCRWLASLSEAASVGDLCIVATQAAGRAALITRIASETSYRSFLVEKVVTQSTEEYESLLAFARESSLSIWINCKTRAYPFHKRVKSLLVPGEPIAFSAVGGNHGLANNGIHAADLFNFYDGSDHIESAGSTIDPVVLPSKRGADVFDLSGTLNGITAKGGRFALTFQHQHTAPDHISILSPSYRCIVDHISRWAWEGDAANGWSWRPVPFEGDLTVSNMTRQFADDLLATGRCELPTLEECYPAHRFVLNELQPHFRRLLGGRFAGCPVT